MNTHIDTLHVHNFMSMIIHEFKKTRGSLRFMFWMQVVFAINMWTHIEYMRLMHEFRVLHTALFFSISCSHYTATGARNGQRRMKHHNLKDPILKKALRQVCHTQQRFRRCKVQTFGCYSTSFACPLKTHCGRQRHATLTSSRRRSHTHTHV